MPATIAILLALLGPAASAPPQLPTPIVRIDRPPVPQVPLPQLVSAADYPASALAARERGRVGFRLDVGPHGRVTACAITRSSGSAALDSTTCRLLRARARFAPAIASDGRPVAASFSDVLGWQLPGDEPVVFTGGKDPRYAIPQRFRDAQQAQQAARIAAERFQQSAEPIYRQVARDPRFGGFVYRWSPAPHAVVMFTGDADRRLRRYTRDPRFRAERVDFTLAQLERMKDRFAVELSRLGLRCSSVDGDEEHNRVSAGVPAEDLPRVRAAIAARVIHAPPRLHLKPEGCATFR